ncbi:DEAD/DEAH box helicase domain-containing protein [Cardiosporidium cionae]|uniref:DEAD/DEAH box helicase domain-containing protein n=1 Tax=Cardiosporidium cionae TaxID=476202 RepID=A0ABQ7J6G8_9APIC|nr:DEAD/DEAH box helicase domain-containing protein [Cardiosporidium cionae]|eukprot:KAF8819555.1 DEAD/DEAH box helicase domain-containing protein [Cardiosporidium cionae]
MEFSDLGVADWIINVCRVLQINNPTKIQKEALPLIYNGKHLIGKALTGSGKTVCYCWPILQRLCSDPFGIYACVLLPTRELVTQVSEQFHIFGAAIGLKLVQCVGGKDLTNQNAALASGPHVVIATPGRLADHLRNPSNGIMKKFKQLKVFVLDEADHLLSKCFEPDLLTILNNIPSASSGRQTLLFTATITPAITKLKDAFNASNNSQMLMVDGNPEEVVPKNLQQKYIFLPRRVHLVYLVYILSQNLKGKIGIIFTATCRECQLVTSTLETLEFSVTNLHSLHNQRRRNACLMKFRSARASLLVATDIASRGLDLPKVDFVINLNFPRTYEYYIHRVGRTARAGKQGLAISFVSERDILSVHAIEEQLQQKLVAFELDEDKVLEKISSVTKAIQKSLLFLEEIGFEEKVVELRHRRKRHFPFLEINKGEKVSCS